MFSFKQKIFLSYVFVFLLFIFLMLPFTNHIVHSLFNNVMQDRATEIICNIKDAPDDIHLVEYLKGQKPLIFFRVSVISDERKVLYDSHTKRLLKGAFSQDYIVNHPEMVDAFRTGVGYNEEYSAILGQTFCYFAKAFDFHGKTYIMRVAFPYKNVSEIITEFKFGFIFVGSIILLLFSFMTWFIINYLTTPIQKIVDIVKTYQEGPHTTIPMITGSNIDPANEFGKLATTLNSLSGKIQNQIDILTDERNEKEAILESLVEGVIATDADMVVSYANQSALKFLNLSYDQLVGHSLESVSESKCYLLLSACQKEDKVLTDTMIIKKDDRKFYLDIVAAPKKNNAGGILVLQDKSVHHKALEMRKDFIANASHELKTPITIILGFAETLHDTPDLPRATIEKITNKIVSNSKRMALLVKDLLALSDTENLSTTRLTEVDICELIENSAVMLRDAFPDCTIEIKKNLLSEAFLLGDPNLLEMAIVNLMENGAKYSKAPAHISIDISQSEEWIQIIIADKGIGISSEHLEHIFERFYTVNKASNNKMGGSGLGLSIVENAIKKHYGKISVSSTFGVGTTFTIQLPITAPHPKGEHP